MRYGPDRSITPQRTCLGHRDDLARIHAVAPSALRPGTMSSSLPRRVPRDGGAPVLFAVPAAAEHQNLVGAQSNDPVEAFSVDVQQRCAPPVHRSHRGVPPAADLRGDITDRSALAGAAGRVTRRPAGRPRPGRRDCGALVDERAHRARPFGAPPAAIAPTQHGRPASSIPITKGSPSRSLTPVTVTPTLKPTTTCNARIASILTGIHQNSGLQPPPILGSPSHSDRDPHTATPRASAKRRVGKIGG